MPRPSSSIARRDESRSRPQGGPGKISRQKRQRKSNKRRLVFFRAPILRLIATTRIDIRRVSELETCPAQQLSAKRRGPYPKISCTIALGVFTRGEAYDDNVF